jgi:hypothetical protein
MLLPKIDSENLRKHVEAQYHVAQAIVEHYLELAKGPHRRVELFPTPKNSQEPTKKNQKHAETVLSATEGRSPENFDTYSDVRLRVEKERENLSVTGGAVVKGAKRAADTLGCDHDGGGSLLRVLREAEKQGDL